MKAFWVDRHGVAAIDEPLDDMLARFDLFDAFELDGRHEVYVEDEGLFAPGVVLARVGSRSRIPLPALVVGFEGERSVDATLTLDEVRGLVSIAVPG